MNKAQSKAGAAGVTYGDARTRLKQRRALRLGLVLALALPLGTVTAQAACGYSQQEIALDRLDRYQLPERPNLLSSCAIGGLISGGGFFGSMFSQFLSNGICGAVSDAMSSIPSLAEGIGEAMINDGAGITGSIGSMAPPAASPGQRFADPDGLRRAPASTSGGGGWESLESLYD